MSFIYILFVNFFALFSNICCDTNLRDNDKFSRQTMVNRQVTNWLYLVLVRDLRMHNM